MFCKVADSYQMVIRLRHENVSTQLHWRRQVFVLAGAQVDTVTYKRHDGLGLSTGVLARRPYTGAGAAWSTPSRKRGVTLGIFCSEICF